MKVKETSKEFFQDWKVKELRKRDDELVLFEQQKKENDIVRSNYLLRNEKYNLTYIEIEIPEPTSDTFKDILLKYQHGVRGFMTDFFDVCTGKKSNIEPIYTSKQKKDLTVSLDENGYSAVIYIILPEGKKRYFGDVSFPGQPELNLKIAENFVKYFEGVPMDSWEEVLL